LKWLDSLTREELHALHSDDHEGKVNWDFAVPPEVEDSKDPESIIDKVGNLKSVPQEQ